MKKFKEVAGNNTSDLSEMNRSAIVRILQQKEICSRAEVAKMMGLTQASITKLVGALIDMGIVSEVGIVKGNGNDHDHIRPEDLLFCLLLRFGMLSILFHT